MFVDSYWFKYTQFVRCKNSGPLSIPFLLFSFIDLLLGYEFFKQILLHKEGLFDKKKLNSNHILTLMIFVFF